MNERTTDESQRRELGLSANSQREQSPLLGARIDPAHGVFSNLSRPHIDLDSLRDSSFAVERENEATASEKSSPAPTPATVAAPAPVAARLNTQFLNEVSQLAQQLHLQIETESADLRTREQALVDQLAVFELEKQRFVHEIANDLSQIEILKGDLQKTQTSLAEQQIEYELQFQQIEEERQQLRLIQVELSQRTESVRSEILAEMQIERDEFDRVRSNFHEEQDRVQRLKGWLQKRLDELASENDRTLQSEREKLWQSLTTEWEQRQSAFQQEREEWVKTRDLEKGEVERERALFESTVESANAEFLVARQALAVELSTLRAAQMLQLQAEQAEWQQVREAEEAKLRASNLAIEGEMQQFQQDQVSQRQAEHANWEEKQRANEAELQATRELLQQELAELRSQHDARLLRERSEWEEQQAQERKQWDESRVQQDAAFEAQHGDLLREQTMVENRIRFQQDHLEKSRFEFEQAQNEHRRERQVERQRIEESGMLMVRRLRQIDLYRSSIDEREKSLDREQDSFQRTQRAIADTVDSDRTLLVAEREGWEKERRIQQADIRRQKEGLATLSESLEGRRGRLDKLRSELEETHRATLEMRLAVEEAWAQLTQGVGQDEARKQVEQVRESLLGYYQQMRGSLEGQTREYLAAQATFDQQRFEFAEERQQLTNWFAARDEDLRRGEERLQSAAVEASSHQNQWLSARDRWLLEKGEAERLIRRLLASLGENNRDQSRSTDTTFHVHEPEGHSVPTTTPE